MKPSTEFHRDGRAPDGLRRQCKSCRSAHVKGWYLDNQARQVARAAERRAADVEKHRRQDRERYLRNRAARIEAATVAVHVRRARLAEAGWDRTITRASLREELGDCCHYCGRVMDFDRRAGYGHPPDQATVDHVIPISRGGGHVRSNVVLSCWQCNAAKGAREVTAWRDSLKQQRATIG